MLATLVIGLREGLEAALIVGIIAAFLKRNGASLKPMWIGVATAVALSIAVGISLSLIEQALPQAAQEAMESVIGAIAIVFVTTMILWMNTHSRGMKKELESEAAAALTQGGAYALAGMAFLAVLKEGFETSVFLLATFSAAQSALLAATGAVIGVLIAVGIGWGIYAGGVRLNLSKFFRATGAFLILVAAGLVITTLRTAHEAGWLNAGQQPTVDLSWLVAPGTVQSALITGVLGIPADPRLIEVIGWFAYLVPVALYVYWPAAHRPRGATVVRLHYGVAAGLVIAAIGLALGYPQPSAPALTHATLDSTIDSSQTAIGTASLNAPDGATASLRISIHGSAGDSIALPAKKARSVEHEGVAASMWTSSGTSVPKDEPAKVTFDELTRLNGGRAPVGINPQQHPGPFRASWHTVQSHTVWLTHGMLLDAHAATKLIVTVSGSGLDTPRTFTATDPSANWTVADHDVHHAAAAAAALTSAQTERVLWAVELPIALGIAALLTLASGYRTSRRLRRSTAPASTAPHPAPHSPAPPMDPTADSGSESHQRNSTYASN